MLKKLDFHAKNSFSVGKLHFLLKKSSFLPLKWTKNKESSYSNNWIFVASVRDRHFNKIVSKTKSVPAEQYRSLRYSKISALSKSLTSIKMDDLVFGKDGQKILECLTRILAQIMLVLSQKTCIFGVFLR